MLIFLDLLFYILFYFILFTTNLLLIYYVKWYKYIHFLPYIFNFVIILNAF